MFSKYPSRLFVLFRCSRGRLLHRCCFRFGNLNGFGGGSHWIWDRFHGCGNGCHRLWRCCHWHRSRHCRKDGSCRYRRRRCCGLRRNDNVVWLQFWWCCLLWCRCRLGSRLGCRLHHYRLLWRRNLHQSGGGVSWLRNVHVRDHHGRGRCGRHHGNDSDTGLRRELLQKVASRNHRCSSGSRRWNGRLGLLLGGRRWDAT